MVIGRVIGDLVVFWQREQKINNNSNRNKTTQQVKSALKVEPLPPAMRCEREDQEIPIQCIPIQTPVVVAQMNAKALSSL